MTKPETARKISRLDGWAALSLLLLLPAAAHAQGAERRVAGADAFARAVNSARPGDRILLAPGDYAGNFYFNNVHGTAENPIVVAAADPTRPPRLVGRNVCIHIAGASHLELRDLTLTGARENGLNIDDRGNPDRPAKGIVLKNLRVRYIGPKGNSDGIKLSGVDDFRVENCTVERWGSDGSAIDMVGCHRGLIVGCVFEKGGANAVQAKGGSSEVVVRKCRFEDAGERAVQFGGWTDDAAFRPPLKGMPAAGRYEAKDVRVEGCVFVGGQAPVAFVSADGAAARFNTIYRPENYAVRILQEKSGDGFVPCRNGVFEDNVVVFRAGKWADGGINVSPGTDPKTFRFARNLWYCEDRPDRSAPTLPAAEKDSVTGQNPRFADPDGKDFRTPADSPAAGKGAAALPEK